MNQFLAEYYGTGAGTGNDDADALEKMAQLTLLAKEAEENDVDLSGLSDEEVVELAGELYGEEGGEGVEEAAEESDPGEQTDDMEKEAAAKFEEADFLGRVMAHSMWQELDNIQKEAGIKDVAKKGYEAVRGAVGKAHEKTLGAIGGKAEAAVRGYGRKGGQSKTMKAIIHRLGGGKGKKTGDTYRKGIERLSRGANIASQVGTAAGGAAAAGGLGYGGYKGVEAMRGKRKHGSALDTLIEQRAIEHLASAGYVDQQGNVYAPETEKTAADQDFNTMIDKAALELLEQNGYPVQWNE